MMAEAKKSHGTLDPQSSSISDLSDAGEHKAALARQKTFAAKEEAEPVGAKNASTAVSGDAKPREIDHLSKADAKGDFLYVLICYLCAEEQSPLRS